MPASSPHPAPFALLGATHQAVAFDVPALACDCHTHVFGPADRYPYAPKRKYTPPDATLADLQALHRHLGIERVVIVQPSPYASDNSATLDALRGLEGRGRAVAVIDEHTSDDELRRMHEAGVRGIRLNLETEGISDAAHARRQLQWAAGRVGPLGWHVQIFTNPAVLAQAGDTIAGLGVPVVVDHFGRTSIDRASTQAGGARPDRSRPGLDILLELLRSGAAWVKLSAPYRLSGGPDSPQVRELAQTMIEANPERMLWGTDWPHPGGSDRSGPVDAIEPFRPIDDGRALNRLAEWVPDRALLEKILVHNPARLYDYQ